MDPSVDDPVGGLGVHRNRLLIQRWKLFAKMFQLGQIVIDDIRLLRMQCQIVLVILLGGIERLQRGHLRHDGFGEGARLGELPDIALRHRLLLGIRVKDRRAIMIQAGCGSGVEWGLESVGSPVAG